MNGRSSVLPSAILGVLLAVFLGGAIWVILGSPDSVAGTGLSLPAGASRDPVYITVQKGDNASTIGKRLQSSGIIESATVEMPLASRTRCTSPTDRQQNGQPGTSAAASTRSARIRSAMAGAVFSTSSFGSRM